MLPKMEKFGPINLSSSVKLYVPSTFNVSEATDNSFYVEQVMTNFSTMFGGATASQNLGGWVTADGKLVTEKVTTVLAYCDSESLDKYIEDVVKLALEVKTWMAQEAIALEVNNELYLL